MASSLIKQHEALVREERINLVEANSLWVTFQRFNQFLSSRHVGLSQFMQTTGFRSIVPP
jgi:hypothetical protein